MIWSVLRRLGPLALLLGLLGGCARGDRVEPTLVFVNDCSRPIAMVGVETEHSSGGSRNADGSLLARGDALPLDCADWPAVVTVFDDLNGAEPLASVTILRSLTPTTRRTALAHGTLSHRTALTA